MAVAIQSVMHVNANCSDLGKSLPFYEDVIGLRAESHTNPVPQDGSGFGLPGQDVQWDAHILHDGRGFAGPGLDLLEWKQPRPVGRPYASALHLGFSRLGVLAPNLGSEREWLADPDGTVIERIDAGPDGELRFDRVVVNCRDLSASIEWYERVLGLTPGEKSEAGEGAGDAFGLEGEVAWESRFVRPPGREFGIQLWQWLRPGPVGEPYPSANHLGLYRMAFLVTDMQEAHAELLAQGATCPEPVWLDMGPDIPIDGLWACFFPDPDGACLELIESPRL
jgi:catechol 2,3-dioxygenase-like lactoylglutathione lyase family enzyme